MHIQKQTYSVPRIYKELTYLNDKRISNAIQMNKIIEYFIKKHIEIANKNVNKMAITSLVTQENMIKTIIYHYMLVRRQSKYSPQALLMKSAKVTITLKNSFIMYTTVNHIFIILPSNLSCVCLLRRNKNMYLHKIL